LGDLDKDERIITTGFKETECEDMDVAQDGALWRDRLKEVIDLWGA